MNFLATFWPGAQRSAIVPPPDVFPTLAENLPPEIGNCRGKRAGKPRQADRQPLRQPSPHRALAVALRGAGRPMTVTELAHAMGCCVGESSKRVKAARGLVKSRRVGRCRLVSLRQMSLSQWLAVFEEAAP